MKFNVLLKKCTIAIFLTASEGVLQDAATTDSPAAASTETQQESQRGE